MTNCTISGSAFLGPVYTGAKTGSVYQTSLSYGSGRVINNLKPGKLLMKTSFKKVYDAIFLSKDHSLKNYIKYLI